MAKDKVFADGIVVFKPKDGSPDWVKGDILIGIDVLLKWANDHPEYLHDYKGDRQIKLQLLDGTKGLYLTVNTIASNTVFFRLVSPTHRTHWKPETLHVVYAFVTDHPIL